MNAAEEHNATFEKIPTRSAYIGEERVSMLHKKASMASVETNSHKQISPSALARYVIDNFLELAVEKMIQDSRKG